MTYRQTIVRLSCAPARNVTKSRRERNLCARIAMEPCAWFRRGWDDG